MELGDLRYFIAVAKEENLQKASKLVHVSPSALSKAIARLETELNKLLFSRERQRLFLTEDGKKLVRHANLILGIEQDAIADIKGSAHVLEIRVAGPEACLLFASSFLRTTLSTLRFTLRLSFFPMGEMDALKKVEKGECELGVVCVPPGAGMRDRILTSLKFHTYAAKSHPLFRKSFGRSFTIEEVLQFPFAVSDLPFFGSVPRMDQNFDGWRDDKFPRVVKYRTASLKILEEAVISGDALAYLPDYYGKALLITRLMISNCPYSCKQNLRLVANHHPERRSWLSNLFK